MDLSFDCKKAEITPAGRTEVNVSIENVSSDDVLSHFNKSELLSYIGEDEALDIIGREKCLDYFDIELTED